MPQRYQGSTIGKYRIDRLLGAGAFAWVYQALDLDLEIQVALKILRPEFVGQDSVVARFRREATLAAKLRHPHIVTVRDIGQVDGVVFVAMDLHPVTLGRRLELLSRLDEGEVVKLGIGVAAALATAHSQHVIHRDIKPDNILIDQNGEAVVADFGLARALSENSSVSATNQILGTPHYFSPEQARGLELDGRSDLYSLGVTLYRAATGSLPFDGENWYAVARQHIECEPRPPHEIASDISPEFESVLLRLLAKDPDSRFSSAVEALDAMLALPSAPALATPLRSAALTIQASPPAPSLQKNRWAAAALALLAITIIGAIGAIFWAKSQTPATASAPNPNTANDSAKLTAVAADSMSPTPAEHDIPATAQASGDKRRSTPKPVTITVRSAPNAELYLNNKLLGVGEWNGTHAAQESLRIRAVLPNASVACETALRDTLLTKLSAGANISVDIPVRGCVVVRYVIQPRDARVTFSPLDGGSKRELRADSAASMSLPAGRYLMRISAPRCSTFEDTVNVQSSTSNNAVTRSLICS